MVSPYVRKTKDLVTARALVGRRIREHAKALSLAEKMAQSEIVAIKDSIAFAATGRGRDAP